MNLRLIFLTVSVLGVIIPVMLVLSGMQNVGWDFAIAISDFHIFMQTIFGQYVIAGYFLSGVSLTFFIMYEANARSDYYLYWALLPLLMFGIGAALPFYLYLRMPKQE